MELKDELELLDELISKTLDPKKILRTEFTAELFLQIEGIANREYEKVRKRLRHVPYSPVKERLKEQYVQQHQAGVILLMDKIIDYLMPRRPDDLIEEEKDSNIVKLYKRIFHLLQELLVFIEKHLTKYFNQDANVPMSYLMLSQAEIRERVKKIKKRLVAEKDFKEITGYILSPISILCGTHQTVSYRKFLFIKELVNELEGLPLNPPPIEGDLTTPWPLQRVIRKDSVIELLYYMNFNCSKVFQRLVEDAIHRVNSIHDQKEKLAWLYMFLKELNQLQVKPGVKLVADGKDLRNKMVCWIEEEIYCLEKKESLFAGTPANYEPISDEEKIHFNVSEATLSLIFRSALDSKLVLYKVKKGVYERVVKIITTIGSRNPKPGSLQKKGHDPERVHKEQAIGILHEMIRWVMKY